jgi:dTMP kinase
MARVVTFEGVEGAGKTTFAHWAAYELFSQGYEVFLSQEPFGAVGGFVRTHLLAGSPHQIPPLSQLFLFEASRVEHARFLRRRRAAEADFVVLDRFVDSTLAYQGYALGLDIGLIESLNRMSSAEFWPFKTFLLDLDPESAAERVRLRSGGNAWDKGQGAFFKAVREGFLRIAENNPDRVTVINALESQEIIREQLRRELQSYGRP